MQAAIGFLALVCVAISLASLKASALD
jgi:hypothetical protein